MATTTHRQLAGVLTGSPVTAITVEGLRREAARWHPGARAKLDKSQLIRAVAQKRQRPGK